MSQEIVLLAGTAAWIGFLHTLFGPDHYLPFAAMSRAGGWSLRRTMVVTLLCGIGHVASSIVLGLIGISFGIAVFRLETIEAARGQWAGWLLLGFGLAYLVWGIFRAVRNRPHKHVHVHSDGTVHSHVHQHVDEHLHVHHAAESDDSRNQAGSTAVLLDHAGPHVRPHSHAGHGGSRGQLTPWVLFTIFLFGPCEPLIPMLMYPAARGSAWGVALVTGVFGAATLLTMMMMVALTRGAARRVPFGRFERYGHALAGAAVLLCGVAIQIGL